MRWPPVSLIIGTSYFSATSAIRRSWPAVVTPPFICGTTENVPSRWMLACTRSLMNRASRSSTNSSPHIISQQRRQRHLATSRPPRRRGPARRTPTTPTAVRAPGSPPSASACPSGCPGTYQCADGSSSTSPPAAHSTICATSGLQEPQPLPARVFVHHAGDASCCRRCTQRPARPCDAVAVADLRVVGQSRPTPDLVAGPAEVEQQLDPLLGQRQPAVERLGQERDLADVAEQRGADQLAVADDDGLVDAAAWARRTRRTRRRAAPGP